MQEPIPAVISRYSCYGVYLFIPPGLYWYRNNYGN